MARASVSPEQLIVKELTTLLASFATCKSLEYVQHGHISSVSIHLSIHPPGFPSTSLVLKELVFMIATVLSLDSHQRRSMHNQPLGRTWLLWQMPGFMANVKGAYYQKSITISRRNLGSAHGRNTTSSVENKKTVPLASCQFGKICDILSTGKYTVGGNWQSWHIPWCISKGRKSLVWCSDRWIIKKKLRDKARINGTIQKSIIS